MGHLEKGKWVIEDGAALQKQGSFKRQASQFRHFIGSPPFLAEPNRYHLYVSYACPWAHRTLIFRKLKRLESLIPITVVAPHMGEQGWSFGSKKEPLYQKSFLSEIYTLVDPHYTGRVTVPVLWDKKEKTIVNNESGEIIRMFNTAFNRLTGSQEDYYPASLRSEIDDLNAWLYDTINNGVYKVGFATDQKVYEKEVRSLFAALDQLEERLARQPFLCGSKITEADWRLFTTLIRFDPVYYIHFKCSFRRLIDYPHLSRYLQELCQIKGIKESVHLDHIKIHYYTSHPHINPNRIIPLGPLLPCIDN